MNSLLALAVLSCSVLSLLDGGSAAPASAEDLTVSDHNGLPEASEGGTTIVVPVARKFSSLKELFQILKEDRTKPPGGVEGQNLTPVNGTQDDSYVIFISD